MDLATSYHDLVQAILVQAGVPRALFLLHAGMAFYLVGLALMGSRRGSLPALLAVVAFAAFHVETDRIHAGMWHWREALDTVLLVLFWPTVCYAANSYRRWAWSQRARERAEAQINKLYDYRPFGKPRPRRKVAATIGDGI